MSIAALPLFAPHSEPPSKSALERFLARTKKKTRGCWEYVGGDIGSGYRALRIDNVRTYAHRYSWELHNGPIPSGKVVRHSCNNTTCVNPAHLRLGTQADNMRDMMAAGRGRSHVLSAEQSAEILRRYAAGESQTAIARHFGVSQVRVSQIVRAAAVSP